MLTPRNFYPVSFGHHFPRTAPAQAPRPSPARSGEIWASAGGPGVDETGPGPEAAQGRLGAGISAPYLLVDAWFPSPKFCQDVKNLGLQVIGRLKRDHTLYSWHGTGYTLDQLYRVHKHSLVKAAALGLSLLRVPVTCSNGLQGAIVLTKGYKEPDLETRSGGP